MLHQDDFSKPFEKNANEALRFRNDVEVGLQVTEYDHGRSFQFCSSLSPHLYEKRIRDNISKLSIQGNISERKASFRTFSVSPPSQLFPDLMRSIAPEFLHC